MDIRNGVPMFDPGSPVGTPLSQDSPAVPRQRKHIPEPFCSPIAKDGDQIPAESPGGNYLPSPSPSPASKRYVGVSNNARNNIYMKTLMNSPYHKSYTPLSATPGFSPAYHTPARTRPDKHESPHPSVTSTPQGTRPPGSAKKFVTPKHGNVPVNPFDHGVDDLHLPAYMSPGFFTIASTPASEEKKIFSWNIEHIAELQPADIDEMPTHQTQHVMPDRETEERAQRAIEQFFATNLIHPSPWSNPKGSKKKNILPVTPASQGSGSKHAEEMITELQGSIQKSLPHQHTMVDTSCQTTLSLPIDFDLQKVLGAYMSQDGNMEEGNQQDMLSTSSLRRKLFFHGDTSSLAPSPVKGVNIDMQNEPCSPLFAKQQPNYERTTPLRNTPNFSSSPIKSAGTPQYRRRSSDPEFLVSPELSPIVHGNLPSTGRKSKCRSSGVFQVHSVDFEISPVSDFRSPHAGRDSLVSPIPFHGISPDNIGDDFRPKFEDSPGFSPIRPPKTPIRKILRRSQEESYIQNDCCDSEEESESVTPVSTNPKLTSNSLTPVDTISPIRQSPRHTLSGTISKSHSCTDLQHTMDFESTSNPRDNILTSSLCDTRDFSASADFSDDTHQRTSLSNQDTGYQTASLQSTNQESVSLHTNLTNQFGSLPFNLTNQDTSHMLISQDKPPVLNLTQHFSMIASQEDDDEDNRVTDVNNHNNAPLFPKQKLLFMDDDVDLEHTPKNSLGMRQNFEDSALPDDLSSSQGKMEIDNKVGDLDFVDKEEEVLKRAWQALARANTLYPQDSEGNKMSVPSITGVERLQQNLSEHITPKHVEQQPSASEIAYSIIQRAGEDLARFGSFKSAKTTEVHMEDVQ